MKNQSHINVSVRKFWVSAGNFFINLIIFSALIRLIIHFAFPKELSDLSIICKGIISLSGAMLILILIVLFVDISEQKDAQKTGSKCVEENNEHN